MGWGGLDGGGESGGVHRSIGLKLVLRSQPGSVVYCEMGTAGLVAPIGGQAQDSAYEEKSP